MPLEARQIDRRPRCDNDANRVAPAGEHIDDPIARSNQTFREEKADRELVVVAGRAHRDRDRVESGQTLTLPLKANLQRLLDREDVDGDAAIGGGAPPPPPLFFFGGHASDPPPFGPPPHRGGGVLPHAPPP